jgi:uncharacterized membrane protein YjdF
VLVQDFLHGQGDDDFVGGQGYLFHALSEILADHCCG